VLSVPSTLHRACHDDIHFRVDQLCDEVGKAIEPLFGIPIFNGDALTFDIAQLAETLLATLLHALAWGRAGTNSYPRTLFACCASASRTEVRISVIVQRLRVFFVILFVHHTAV
jgi:hypothetical protein